MTNENNNKEKGEEQTNKPATELDKSKLTIDQLDEDLQDRIHLIRSEFIHGLHFIRQHKHSVTFFGSARYKEDNKYYQKARKVARRLASAGIDVVTGGGPGIMEAANRGAAEVEQTDKTGEEVGHSLGLNIKLPNEQVLNPYVEKNEEFHYFFARKVVLTFSAEAYIFFPGGFGTLDEFLEILTLVQTEKISKVPIILVGTDFWQPLTTFIKETLLEKFETISPNDMDLFYITNDEKEIVRIAKEAPLRNQ